MKLSQETSSILENLAEILERVSIAMCSQWTSSLSLYITVHGSADGSVCVLYLYGILF